MHQGHDADCECGKAGIQLTCSSSAKRWGLRIRNHEFHAYNDRAWKCGDRLRLLVPFYLKASSSTVRHTCGKSSKGTSMTERYLNLHVVCKKYPTIGTCSWGTNNNALKTHSIDWATIDAHIDRDLSLRPWRTHARSHSRKFWA